jgi:SM-20-related protein
MPGLDFFKRLGLYIVPQFQPEHACQELIKIMASSPKRQGLTVGTGGTSRLDERRRSVGDAKVPKAATAVLMQSILALQPELERHFGMPLEWGGEGPDYLVYQSGDFFKPHRDTDEYPPVPDSRIRRRRVAVILFLNRYSDEYREDCFGGGLLNFYGLLEGPQWKDCVFGLEPEPGLLVAFSASLMHEVTPITFGQRYSILTAFHAPLASSQSTPK